jgi:hypothetical protein
MIFYTIGQDGSMGPCDRNGYIATINEIVDL